MKFKEYLRTNIINEFVIDIKNLNKKRIKLHEDLSNLMIFIDKKHKKKFSKALSLILPSEEFKTLENKEEEFLLEKQTIKNISKKLNDQIISLADVTDEILKIPYYGEKEEKIIEQEFYNLCEALSIFVFSKIDDKYIKNIIKNVNKNKTKNVNEGTFGQISGSLAGGSVGGMLFGPAGILLGLVLGLYYGDQTEEKIVQKYNELKDNTQYKIKSINWQDVMVQSGLIFGSIAGLMMFGSLTGLIGVGLVGGVLGGYLHQEFSKKLNESIESIESIYTQDSFLNEFKMPSFNLDKLKQKFNSFFTKIISILDSEQKKLYKKLIKLYSVRKQKISQIQSKS